MKARYLLTLGVILVGCSSADSNDQTLSVNKSLSVQVPDYKDPSNLKLPNGRRFIVLGDTEDKALSIFPRPSRGFPLEEVIPGFPADFVARGWETNAEGFGFILHEDKIVLAMHQYEAVEADEFASILANVQTVNNIDHFQSAVINKAEYWYTTSGIDEIVISRIAGAKKRYQVSVTLGNQSVVNALGILKDVNKTTPASTATDKPIESNNAL